MTTPPLNAPTFRHALQFFLYETRPTWLADDGTLSYEELAKAVEEWLVALPVEQRMEAMKMRLAGWLHTDPGKCNHIKGTRHCTNTSGTWIPLYVEANQ